MTRLLLVRHAATAATERRAFGADEPITDRGRAAAAALAAQLPPAEATLSSPALRCRQTAESCGTQPTLDDRLAECRFGTWEGRSFEEISRDTPDLVNGWLRDPDAAPHGGESLSCFAARVAAWLQAVAAEGRDSVVAFTHAGVIRAAVIAAMRAPLDTFWRLTAAPLSVTELQAHDGVWMVIRANWTAML